MLEKVRETLIRLLEMNTPPGHEGPVADFLEGELQAMGFATWRDDAGQKVGGQTGNVLARLSGTVPDAPAIFFNAHMDTVAPTEGLVIREENGVLRSSGNTILGADDKAGLTAILEGLRAAIAEGFPRPTLEVAFTICEENGLWGAKYLDYASLTARQGYAFDSGKPVGGIVNAAPSQNSMTFVVHGVASHAGAAPEKGVNAILLASQAITRMPLGRIDHETTSNIGVIHGGQATNIVPDRVECRGEARSHSEEKLQRQTDAMCDAFRQAADAGGGRAEITVTRSYDRFHVDADDPLVQRAAEAARRAGVADPSIHAGGGGSDANVFNKHGVSTVVIGLGYENVHAVDEYVAIEDVATAAHVVAEIVRLAGEGGSGA